MRLWLEPSPDAHFVRVILSCLLVKKKIIYLVLAVLGLRCSVGFSPVAVSGATPWL